MPNFLDNNYENFPLSTTFAHIQMVVNCNDLCAVISPNPLAPVNFI